LLYLVDHLVLLQQNFALDLVVCLHGLICDHRPLVLILLRDSVSLQRLVVDLPALNVVFAVVVVLVRHAYRPLSERLSDKLLEYDLVPFDLFVSLGFQGFDFVFRLRISKLSLHFVQSIFKLNDFFLNESECTSINFF
jgi:hypothetical protein